ELRLVDGHVLDADGGFVAAHADDAIDHQERIAVRQRLQNSRDVGRLKRDCRLAHVDVLMTLPRSPLPICARRSAAPGARAPPPRGRTASRVWPAPQPSAL